MFLSLKDKFFCVVVSWSFSFGDGRKERIIGFIKTTDTYILIIQKLEKKADLPKTVIYHGAKDVNIPPDTSAKMLAEALEKAGADVTLELFDDVEHNTYAMGKSMENRLRVFFSVL